MRNPFKKIPGPGSVVRRGRKCGILDEDGEIIAVGEIPEKTMFRDRAIRVKDGFCLLLGLFSLLFVIAPAFFLAAHGMGWTGVVMVLGAAGLAAAITGFFGR